MGGKTKSFGPPFTLHQLPSGKLQARGKATVDGFRFQKSTKATDEAEAWQVAAKMYSEWLQDLRAGRLKAQATAGDKGLLSVVAESWIESVEAKGRSASTIRGYQGNVEVLKKYFGFVSKIDEDSVAQFIERRLDEVQRHTLKHDLTALRGILKTARKQGLITHLPTWQLDQGETGTPVPGRRGAAIELTVEEARAIIMALPEFTSRSKFPVRDFCSLLWETGLRPTLWLRVQPEIHFGAEGSTLEVTEDIDKAKWERTLPLSELAITAMWRVWERSRELSHNHQRMLFPDQYGEAYASAPIKSGSGKTDVLKTAAVKVLGKRKGSRMHPSVFRRAFINNIKHNRPDIDLPGEMYLVGHKQTNTNDRYKGTQYQHVANAYGTAGKKVG